MIIPSKKNIIGMGMGGACCYKLFFLIFLAAFPGETTGGPQAGSVIPVGVQEFHLAVQQSEVGRSEAARGQPQPGESPNR